MEMLIYNRDYEPIDGYNKGDIIEIRQDGYWSNDHDFNRKAFKLILMPNIDKSLMDKEYYLPYSNAKSYKRRYKLDITSTETVITINSLQDLVFIDKTKVRK